MADKITTETVRGWKGREQRLAALTAYDYPTARLLDEAGVDVLLVGDSLGMTVLGYADTTWVTLDDIVHHTRAVSRGVRRALVIADLPIHTYRTPEEAVRNARRLREAGADAVKLEGGVSVADQIHAIVAAGVPCMAHLGKLPQRILDEGGNRGKDKTEVERSALWADGDAVVVAGAFATVLELVKPGVAAEMTERLPIPTVGIGSGERCDGQILVVHDLVGAFPWFTPKHVRPRGDVAGEIRRAVGSYLAGLRADPRPEGG